MKMKWIFLAASMATTGFAHAADVQAEEISAFAMDPQEVLEALSVDRDERRTTQPPKACQDAAIRDDQKAAIESAVLDAKREKIKVKADLKVAMMDYARSATDPNSDKATAEAAAGKIVEGVNKLASGQVGLATRILYDLVTPEQRKNTFLCLVELHKKQHKKCKYDDKDDLDDDDND